jgi:Protein of unknown function (DUF2971)
MLFKYVRADNGGHALELLKCFCEKYTLKASAPTSFNDPFEFKVTVDFEADEATIRERYFVNKPDSSDTEYESWRRHHTKDEWWVVQETRKELLSRFGVCCLSEVDDNHLMWSHYASEHQSFCVGFEEKQLYELPGVTGFGPVEYRENAPRFRYYFDSPETFEAQAVACKSSLWAYEREHRIVFKSSGIVPFPPSALQEVSLGCRAHMALRDYAEKHCDQDGVKFFQMAEDFQAYRLRKEPIRKNVRIMSSFF